MTANHDSGEVASFPDATQARDVAARCGLVAGIGRAVLDQSDEVGEVEVQDVDVDLDSAFEHKFELDSLDDGGGLGGVGISARRTADGGDFVGGAGELLVRDDDYGAFGGVLPDLLLKFHGKVFKACHCRGVDEGEVECRCWWCEGDDRD